MVWVTVVIKSGYIHYHACSFLTLKTTLVLRDYFLSFISGIIYISINAGQISLNLQCPHLLSCWQNLGKIINCNKLYIVKNCDMILAISPNPENENSGSEHTTGTLWDHWHICMLCRYPDGLSITVQILMYCLSRWFRPKQWTNEDTQAHVLYT